MVALDFTIEGRCSGAKPRGLGVVSCRVGGGGIKEGSDVVIVGLWCEDAREWRNWTDACFRDNTG